MLSQQELSDRLEIQDLVYHYADLIDTRGFDQLREEVFSADAHIDYSAMGRTAWTCTRWNFMSTLLATFNTM